MKRRARTMLIGTCITAAIGAMLGLGANWWRVCSAGWVPDGGLNQWGGWVQSSSLLWMPVVQDDAFGMNELVIYVVVGKKVEVHPFRGKNGRQRAIFTAPEFSYTERQDGILWEDVPLHIQAMIHEQMAPGTNGMRILYEEFENEHVFHETKGFVSDTSSCPVLTADFVDGAKYGAFAGAGIWLSLCGAQGLLRKRRRSRRRRLGQCEECAYPLIDGFCPECGSKPGD